MPEDPPVGETPNPNPDVPIPPPGEDRRATPAPHELGDENAQPS